MTADPEKIALIDMDGTIADYESAMVRDLKSLAAPEEDDFDIYSESKPRYLKNRIDMIGRQVGWWDGLDVLYPGLLVVDIMRHLGFDLHILTKGPSTKSRAWSEKVEWVRREVPDANITITEDKGIAYGRVLFDDYPEYAKRWLTWRPRGLVLMLESKSNERFEHPNVVKVPRDLINNVPAQQLITEKLEEAFNR